MIKGKRAEIGLVLCWAFSVLCLTLLATGENQFLLSIGSVSLLVAGAVPLISAPRCFVWSLRELPVSIIIGLSIVSYVYWRSSAAWVLPEGRFDFLLAITGLSVFLLTRAMVEMRAGSVAVVLSVLGLLVVVNVCVGVYQLSFGSGNFFPIPGYERVSYDSSRLGVFFNHPNQFGAFAGLLGAISMVHVLIARAFKGKQCFWFVVALCCAVGVLMSGSRALLVVGSLSVFLLLGLCGFAVARLQGKMPRWVKIGAISLGVVVPIVLALGALWVGERRAEGIFGGMKERRLMRAISYEQFLASPILGSGGGTYREFSRQFRSSEWPPYMQDADPAKAHSDWVQLLGEYGLVGAAIALGCLLLVFLGGWKVILKVRHGQVGIDELRWWVALLTGLVFVGLHSAIDFPLRSPAVLTLLSTMMGAAFGLRTHRINTVSMPRPHAAGFACVVCMNAWVFVWGGGLVSAEQAGWRREYPTLAIESMQTAISQDPNNADYHYQLGNIWVRMGERFSNPTVQRSFFAKAEAAFADALALREESYVFVEALAVIRDRQGKFAEAEPLHLRARELAPRHRRCRVNYCLHLDAWSRALSDPERIEQAIAEMEQTLAGFGNGDSRLVDALVSLRKDYASMRERLEVQQ